MADRKPRVPRSPGPFRLFARAQVALVVRKALRSKPLPNRVVLKRELRKLLVELKVGSYRRRVVREEMRRAGVPFRSPPDLRQLSLFPDLTP